jgi:hypothetical protein
VVRGWCFGTTILRPLHSSDLMFSQRSHFHFAKLVLLVVALAVSRIANAEPIDEVFFKFFQILQVADKRSDLDRQLVRTVRTNLRTIQDVTRQFPSIPVEYVATLSANAHLFELAVATKKGDESKALLEIVVRDLDLKIKFESSVFGARDVFRGKVAISVRTRIGDGEESGLIVSANPLRWPNAYPMFTLAPSSPAHGAVPPGIYQFTVSRQGAAVVRQDIPVGLTGRDAEELVIILPPSSSPAKQ